MIKKDSFFTGFIPGLILPLAGAFVFYLVFFRYMDVWYFIKLIINSQKWLSVVSLGAILNMGLFMFFYQKNLDRSAKGVIGATMLYAFIVAYFKAF